MKKKCLFTWAQPLSSKAISLMRTPLLKVSSLSLVPLNPCLVISMSDMAVEWYCTALFSCCCLFFVCLFVCFSNTRVSDDG